MKNRVEDEARQKIYPEDLEAEREFKLLQLMYIAVLILIVVGFLRLFIIRCFFKYNYTK